MMEKKMLYVKDIQVYFGIGRDKAYSLMRNKAFPSIRIGKRYAVSSDAIERWLRNYEGKTFYL